MKRHALFVGVDQYADQNIQELHCAVNDATELAGFFKHRAGFDRAEALANPRNSEVVLERVRDMLDGLVGGDEFLFFFAGHGIKTLDGHRLVCASDQLSEVKHSWAGLPLERLKANTSGAFDRLFLLDACRTDVHATHRGAGGGMEEGTRDLILGSVDQTSANGGKLTIVCSCDDGECAGESLSLHHGLFTLAMLELLDEESQQGRRVRATDEFVYGRLPERMRVLSEKSDMVFGQKPQKRGPAILILDGTDSLPMPAAGPRSRPGVRVSDPTLVVCPICGKNNREEETFQCLECGHDNLCLRHQDEETFLCASCMAKRKQKAAAEAARKIRERAEEEQKARERSQAKRAAGEKETLKLPGGGGMEMVWCPPGRFLIGESGGGRMNDTMQHWVELTKGFWMAKVPVTQAQWRSVMGNNPSSHKGDNLPVECVSWNDVQEFCWTTGNGLQLPTEAQWEYACRAGTTGPYGGTGRLDEMGWYDGNSGLKLHPVGTKQPNAWGLYDMHGNVYEWCADWYGAYEDRVMTDPKGASAGAYRVMRGGCCIFPDYLCRSSERRFRDPLRADYYLGFRPVRILP